MGSSTYRNPNHDRDHHFRTVHDSRREVPETYRGVHLPMRYVPKEHHVEIHPENDEDVKRLREQYPHLWPFQYVCVANDPEDKVSLK